MKKACAICMFLVIVLIAGCTDSSEQILTEPAPEEPVAVYEQETGTIETDDSQADSGLKSSLVFDFADLPEDDFPRGKWTINQLIDKYGVAESMIASYWPEPGFESVSVEIFFENIHMEFWPLHVSCFSFYGEAREPVPNSGYEEYELNEDDKNIELEVLASVYYDKDLEFPYGIKIGQSTKSEIIAAYPENAAAAYYGPSGKGDGQIDNSLWVYYGFRDENGNLPEFENPVGTSICYCLDEANVLQSVEIVWQELIL